MPRGRRKKSDMEVEMAEVRESCEANEIESANKSKEIVKEFIFKEFKRNFTDSKRDLTEVDIKNVIDLSKIVNKYICNIDISLEICEKYIRNIHLSNGCLRLYSRMFYNNETVRLRGLDVLLEVIKIPQRNVDYKFKAVYVTYNLDSNEVSEVELLTI